MPHTAFEQNSEILRSLAKGYILRNGAANGEPSAAELAQGPRLQDSEWSLVHHRE